MTPKPLRYWKKKKKAGVKRVFPFFVNETEKKMCIGKRCVECLGGRFVGSGVGCDQFFLKMEEIFFFFESGLEIIFFLKKKRGRCDED